MLWEFNVRLYRPDFTGPNDFVDITDRVLSIGKISYGISAADDLFQYQAGDVDIELDDEDGALAAEFADVGYTALDARFQVRIDRKSPTTGLFRRLFWGFANGTTVKRDRLRRRISMTIFGPKRLLDWFDADTKLRRTFPALSIVTDAPVGTTRLSVSLSALVHAIVVDDRIRINPVSPTSDLESSDEYLVVGVGETTIDISPPLTAIRAAGSPIVCVTPFFRNQDLKTFVEYVFDLAGMPAPYRDVRYTGTILKSSRPFLSRFNTNGLPGYGAPRGVIEGLKGGPRILRVNHDPGKQSGAFFSVAAEANTQSSGFIDGGQNLIASPKRGGYYDRVDAGQNDPNTPPDFTAMKLVTANHSKVSFSGSFNATYIHTTERTTILGVYMFRMTFKQVIADVVQAFPYSGRLDYQRGGRAFQTYLERLTTIDGGITWTVDTTAFNTQAPSIQIFGTTGTTTYTYVVEAVYSLDGNQGGFCGSDPQTTTTGNATLNTTNFNRVLWNPQNWGDGADTITLVGFNVYRTQGFQTVRVNQFTIPNNGSTFQFFNDDNTQPTTFAFPVTGKIYLGSGDDSTGNGGHGCFYDHSIQTVEGIGGLNAGRTLVLGVYNGGGNNGLGSFLIKILLDISLKKVNLTIDALHITNYSINGVRMFVPFFPNTSAQIYWKDVNLGILIHARYLNSDSNGTNFLGSGRYGKAIPLGSNEIMWDTMKWTRSNATVSASFFFQNPDDGGLHCAFMTISGSNPGKDMNFTAIVTVDRAGYRSRQDYFQKPIEERYIDEFDAIVLAAPVICNYWRISIGGAATVFVLVGYTPRVGWFLLSEFHSGFFGYLDATGKSGSQFLAELGFPVNAVVRVEWEEVSGNPFGIFLSRDLVPTIGAVVKDYTTSTGEPSPDVISASDERVYLHSAAIVKLKWGGGEMVRSALVDQTSGLRDFQDRGRELSVACPQIETEDLAAVVCEALLDFYCPRDAAGGTLSPRKSCSLTLFDDGDTLFIPQSQIRFYGDDGAIVLYFVENVQFDPMGDQTDVDGFRA